MVFVLLCSATALAQQPFLFVWAGDDGKKSEDFLAVFDADPGSANYGQVLASVAVPGPTATPHHTELEMPPGGFLLANGFELGRTTLFDLRDPMHPKVVRSFTDLDGYSHPHTYVRLANGHILATFQHHGMHHDPTAESGGLVEFDDHGKVFRSSSAKNVEPDARVIRPYSLVVVPKLDRVVSTSTSMHKDLNDSDEVQIWRLSDLKLLRTIHLPAPPNGGQQNLLPGEPRLLPDGKTVLVHTFRCGLYELDGVDNEHATARLAYTFEGSTCAVPLALGHYWVQTLFSAHALVAVDIADLAHPKEVSRISLDDAQKPHWIAAEPGDRRILLNSGEYGEHRLFVVNFDPETGTLSLDTRFHDRGANRPGVSMDGKAWPHGFAGDAYPHGAVFSNVAK